MNWFWIGLVAILCFVAVTAIMIGLWARKPAPTATQVAIVPPPPTATGAAKPTVTTTSYVPSELLSKALPWLIAVAVICGIIYILPSPPKVQGNVDVSWLNTIDLGIAFAVVITLGLFYLVINGKGGLPAAIALCVIVASFFFFGDDVFKVLKTVQKETAGAVLGTTQSSKAKNAERVVRTEVSWNKKESDGTIPFGVWSEYFRIPFNRTVDFAPGNGVLYEACVKWEHEADTMCRMHVPGTHTKGAEFKFRLLEAGKGMKQAPVQVR